MEYIWLGQELGGKVEEGIETKLQQEAGKVALSRLLSLATHTFREGMPCAPPSQMVVFTYFFGYTPPSFFFDIFTSLYFAFVK